ncbi:hypothetical protein L3Y34_011430 [Caenorhabditis briggsae]|uniref:Uncharacterized protein n=1 Tax=Caenorhabditis briggsae TaxID=6238 RepID=A0AAE9CTX6_CAEBR|nr:hypothetical protein L3Y34_011430 [Caenorhabditis briggsae]
MVQSQHLAQQLPKSQAPPASLFPTARPGMSDGLEEGSSTSSQTNKSGKRKCQRRGDPLDVTEPPARRQ